MLRNLKFGYYTLVLIVTFLCVLGCTEPFAAPTEDFEDILVIDAVITSEEKRQEIFISNTFLFGDTLQIENGANVIVSDDRGNNYTFQETVPGTYISDIPFGAQRSVSYSLSVVTSNGSSFRAGPLSISKDAVLESIQPVRTTAEDGQEGIAILVNGFDADDEAVFYRYDYAETFKIVSVVDPAFDLVVLSENPPALEKIFKTRQESICYRTQFSNQISTATAENLSESRVEHFQVRFLPKNAFELRSRYSILVNQYVQSQTAKTFYEDLQEFSNAQTLFTQTQPGFIKGNIIAENENNMRVLGLFEVSQVSSRRIFLEYDDFFTDNDAPEFIIDCPVESYLISNPPDQTLFSNIKSGAYKYRGEDVQGVGEVFLVSPTGCVDCTVFGTNVMPDFWEE